MASIGEFVLWVGIIIQQWNIIRLIAGLPDDIVIGLRLQRADEVPLDFRFDVQGSVSQGVAEFQVSHCLLLDLIRRLCTLLEVTFSPGSDQRPVSPVSVGRCLSGKSRSVSLPVSLR